MRNAFILALIFAIIGVVAGYIIFAKDVTGHYIGIDQLLGFKGNIFRDFFNNITGKNINSIRTNILFVGAGGLVAGFLIGLLFKGKNR